MKIEQIGSKYEETKERLRKEILAGSIASGKIENDFNFQLGYTCYFCRKPIKGDILFLAEQVRDVPLFYYLDGECFFAAKNCFYVDNIPYSIN
jgi:hypothetical protein